MQIRPDASRHTTYLKPQGTGDLKPVDHPVEAKPSVAQSNPGHLSAARHQQRVPKPSMVSRLSLISSATAWIPPLLKVLPRKPAVPPASVKVPAQGEAILARMKDLSWHPLPAAKSVKAPVPVAGPSHQAASRPVVTEQPGSGQWTDKLFRSSNPDVRKLAVALSAETELFPGFKFAPNKEALKNLLLLAEPDGMDTICGEAPDPKQAERALATLAAALDCKPLPHTGLATSADMVAKILANCRYAGEYSNQGAGTSTCAASVIERQVRRDHIDSYIDVAVNLLTSGKAALKDGTVLKSEPVDFTVNEGRSVVSDAVQEALIRAGEDVEKSDGQRFGGFQRASARASFAGNEGGMSALSVTKLLGAISGTDYTQVTDREAIRQIVGRNLNQMVNDAGFAALLRPETGSVSGHAVTVAYFKPGGEGGGLVGIIDPAKPNALNHMQLNDFLDRIDSAIVKSAWLKPPGLVKS
ncbi:MAG: hypothetical protein VKP72_05255 [bacterium]|nr:hypothetical protein [bacterium]